MSGVEAVTYFTQALFLGVAIYVAQYTLSRPNKSNFNVLAFFALLAIVISYAWVQRLVEISPGPIERAMPVALVLALPYVLLRLARDFSSVPQPIIRACETGLIAAVALAVVVGVENFVSLSALVLYFTVVSLYAASRFYSASVDANGLTRKRLIALCLASGALGLALFTVIFTAALEGLISAVIEVLRQFLLSASALLYLTGFAPPRIVRRSWQEPELRQFLRQTLMLARWSSSDEVLRHLERVTAETVGAPHAVIGLYNHDTGLLEYKNNQLRPGQTIGGKAFLEQRPILSLDTITDDPESREIYERGQAFAVMAAPIRTDEGTIGVIALYSPNPPIFADDDLSLLGLLADQIGVMLENRKHLQVQAELAAREETTRLKDEFLSVAAHDLKTPLTTIIATGQYLERRMQSSQQEESTELRSQKRLNREAKRLRTLVQGLLDASRIERGQLVAEVEEGDLAEVLHEVVERAATYGTHKLESDVDANLVGSFDSIRIQQVIENLIENAQKYSPLGSTIFVRARSEGDELLFSVSDQGPGIQLEDQQRVFDQYYRGPEASNGNAPGIGLGLYICREIVRAHGGNIWIDSLPGEGTTVNVSLNRGRKVTSSNEAVDTRSG